MKQLLIQRASKGHRGGIQICSVHSWVLQCNKLKGTIQTQFWILQISSFYGLMSHLIICKEDRPRSKAYKAHLNLYRVMFWISVCTERNYSSSKVLVFILYILYKLLPSAMTLYCVEVAVWRQMKSLSSVRILTFPHVFAALLTWLSLGLCCHMWSFL